MMQKRTTEEGGGYRIPHQRLREVLLYLRMKDRNPRLERETIKEWLSLPETEELEGALALIANELWLNERAADLADFATTDLGAEALARMLARRLELREEPDVLTQRIKKMLDVKLTEGATLSRMATLLLFDIPILVTGTNFEVDLQPVWELILKWLKSNEQHFQNKSDWHRFLAVSYTNIADSSWTRGEKEKALQYYAKGLKILEPIYKTKPYQKDLAQNISVLYGRIGDVHSSFGGNDKAFKFYHKGLDVVKPFYDIKPEEMTLARDVSFFYGKLGDYYQERGNPKEAQIFYEKALEIRLKLYKAKPSNLNFVRDVIIFYERLGKILSSNEEAISLFKKGLEIGEKLFETLPQKSDLDFLLGGLHGKLGEKYMSVRKYIKALEHYKKGLEIAEKLYSSNPENTNFAYELSKSYGRLADALMVCGDSPNAFDFYKKGITIAEKLYESNPKETSFAYHLCFFYDRLGGVFLQTLNGKYYGLVWLEKAKKIAEQLYNIEPARQDITNLLLNLYKTLASIYLPTKEAKKAIPLYENSIKINLKLLEINPQRADLARDVGVSYSNLGDVYLSENKEDKARLFYKKCSDILERLYQSEPQNINLARDMSILCDKMAKLSGDFDTEEGKMWLKRGRNILRQLKKEGRMPDSQAESYLEWLEENLK